MKRLNQNTARVLGAMLLLIIVAVSCTKNTSLITPANEVSSFTGIIDGNTLSVSPSALSTTFFSSAGDNVSALQTTVATDASGGGLTFYIPDISVASNTITPKLGTSSNPGSPELKILATGATSTTTQVYVSYKVNGNVYYAISGTVTTTVDGTKVTVKWSLTFTDATGRVFTSTGSFVIYNYKAVTQPKTSITDPTPVALKPTIESIAATSGAPGDSVVIVGTNFSTTIADNVVKFNGLQATVKSATATKLIVYVPANVTTGAVTVKVKNSETTTGPIFTYSVPVAAQPTIAYLSPASGAAGDTVIIGGTNFSTALTANLIKFNGVATVVKSATATRLVVVLPSGGTTGVVTVKVSNSETTTGPVFTYIALPIVSGITPLSGKAGATMTIVGNNFSTTLTDDVVTINGVTATVVTSSVDGMTVTVPQNVTSGAIVVKVKGKTAAANAGIGTTFTVTI